MARFALTHALPRADTLAAQLRADGHEVAVLAYSVLTARVAGSRALRDAMPDSGDLLVCVSPSAAYFAAAALAASVPPDLHFLAIGPGTADALRACGLVADTGDVLVPSGPTDAEAILELPVLADGQARRLIVLAGVGGRDDWQQILVRRGFRLERIDLYERGDCEPPQASWRMLQDWAREDRAVSFLITARRSAGRLDQGLARFGLTAWAHAQRALCPHPRIGQCLREMQWRRVEVVDSGRRLLDAAIESQ